MKKHLNEQIAAAIEARRLASEALKEAAKLAQADCDHEIIAETPWRSGGFNPLRICLHCRLQEEGSHWSGGKIWSRLDYGSPVLGNSDDRIVTTVDRDDFYALRLPGFCW